MAIAVQCTDCGKHYRVDDRMLGKRVKCNGCGNTFIVAAPAPPPAPEPVQEEDPFAAMQSLIDAANTAPASSAPPPVPSRSATPPPMPSARPKPIHAAVQTSPAIAYANPVVLPRRNDTVGVDSATPWLLLMLIASYVGVGIWMTIQYSSLPDDIKAIGPGIGVIWTTVITALILFFAIIGPLILLAMFIGSKIMRFSLPDMAYLKACGVGAVPAVVLALAFVIPPNPILRILLLVASIPLAFYVMYFAFGLRLGEAAVSFAFSGIFYVIGWFLCIFILTIVVAGFKMAGGNNNVASNSSFPTPIRAQTYSNGSSSSQSQNYTPPTPTPRVDPNEQAITTLQRRITMLNERAASGSQSREMFQSALSDLKDDATALRARIPDHVGWVEIDSAFDQAQRKGQELPSNRPPDTLFTAPVTSQDWTASPQDPSLGDEVSFKAFKLRVPKHATFNLDSSETSPSGLTWRAKADTGQLTLLLFPRNNPRQQRPWIATHQFMLSSAAAEKLFAVDAAQGTSSEGKINGTVFTRIEMQSGNSNSQRVQYVALTPDGWLVARLSGNQPGTFEQAVRSIRHAPNEPKIPLFTPETLAARLTDPGDRDQAAAMLRSMGASAEAAVIPYARNSDWNVAAAAINVLADIGGDKSVEVLTSIVSSSSSHSWTADAARKALAKMQGPKSDPLALTLLDAKSSDTHRARAGLEALAATKVDPARRDEVMSALMQQFTGDRLFFISDSLGKAMTAWADPASTKDAGRLVTYLDDDDDRYQRQIAMKVLGSI